MNEDIAQCFSIPVLMLMIRDLEFQRIEHVKDGYAVAFIDEAIRTCEETLKEKTDNDETVAA